MDERANQQQGHHKALTQEVCRNRGQNPKLVLLSCILEELHVNHFKASRYMRRFKTGAKMELRILKVRFTWIKKTGGGSHADFSYMHFP